MKRLAIALVGITAASMGAGCCCGNGWGWGNPYGANYGAAPAGAYLTPTYSQAAIAAPVTVSAAPGTYIGGPVTTTAFVPVESLPTY